MLMLIDASELLARRIVQTLHGPASDDAARALGISMVKIGLSWIGVSVLDPANDPLGRNTVDRACAIVEEQLKLAKDLNETIHAKMGGANDG